MEEEIKKLTAALEAMQPIMNYLVAENAAMAAVIRALAFANRENPTFLAGIKVEAETRNIGQLNSTMSDKSIEAVRKSLASLLPPQLRDI